METPTSRSGPRWLRRAAFGTAACGLLVLVYLGGARVLERWRALGVFEPHEIRTPDRAEKTVAEPSPQPPASRPMFAQRDGSPTKPEAPEPKHAPADKPEPQIPEAAGPEAAGPELAGPELTGMHNGVLAGRTVDESGQAVPFAELRLWTAPDVLPSVDWHRPARTSSSDADGYFALDELASSASDTTWFTLVAESAGHRSIHAISGSLAPDDVATGVTMQMHERWDLPGEVFVPHGASAAHLEILAQSENVLAMRALRGNRHRGIGVTSLPQIRSRTDGSGRFFLPLTPEKWLITIRHPTYPAHIEWVWDEPYIDVWFEVGLTFAGRVTDAEGKPIAGAHVYYWNSDERRGPATTDANGEYALDGIYRGDTGSLAFVGPAHAPKIVPVSTESTEDVVRRDIELRAERRIEGVVLDTNGAPAGGREVNLLTGMRNRKRMGLDHATKTDAAGRFVFDRLTDDALEIVVLREGKYPEAKAVAKPGADEVVLYVKR